MLEDVFVVRQAVSMCILQIGELVGNLSDEFKAEHNVIPWREIKAIYRTDSKSSTFGVGLLVGAFNIIKI